MEVVAWTVCGVVTVVAVVWLALATWMVVRLGDTVARLAEELQDAATCELLRGTARKGEPADRKMAMSILGRGLEGHDVRWPPETPAPEEEGKRPEEEGVRIRASL